MTLACEGSATQALDPTRCGSFDFARRLASLRMTLHCVIGFESWAAPVGWVSQCRRPARNPGLHDGRERPAGWQQEGGHYLREGPAVVAGGVDQTARIDPRLTGREHLDVALALECQLAVCHHHQLLSAVHVPWCPDAWIEVEQHMHQLECSGRPLDSNRGMVDGRGARSARSGIQDAVIVGGAGGYVATVTRPVDDQVRCLRQHCG